MRFLRRSLIGLFLVSLTAGFLAVAVVTVYQAVQTRLNDEPGERVSRERVFAVNSVRVESGTFRPVLTSYGEVRSRRTLELRASSAGTIIELVDEMEDGGTVKAGDLLVRVNPADAQSARDVARADLQEAEADLRDARRSLELAQDELVAAEDQVRLRDQALQRQRDLQTRGVGTDAAVETAELADSAARQAVLSRRQASAQAEARIDSAMTTVERGKINLAEAERRLTDTEIRAAFDGTLADVSAVEGGTVATNERLAELIDPSSLEVSFRVSTAQYLRLLDEDGRLITGDVRIVLDVLGVDLTTDGRITRESAAVGEGQAGRILFARLENPAGFRPGDFVTVLIQEPELQDVALLPSTAVDSSETVLVISEDSRLERVGVELMRRQRDDVVIRASSLEGRDVVAERSPLLGSGIKVRVLSPSGTEDPTDPEMMELTEERRARLVDFIETSQFMPQEAKARILAQLSQPMVPLQVVERIESRMGG